MGLRAVSAKFCDPLFIIHDRSSFDYGVDITVEALLDGKVTNFRGHLQLKSRTLDPNADGSFSVSVPMSNLSHLLGQPLSAYLLYHAQSRRLFLRYAIDVAEDHRRAGRSFDADSLTVRFDAELDAARLSSYHELLVRHGRAGREARFRLNGHQAVVAQVEELARQLESSYQHNRLLALLVREASRYVERAMELESKSSYLLAIQSLTDAEALLKESGADPQLLLRALVLRCGIEATAGLAHAAVASGREAVDLLPQGPLNQVGAWAHGNLGMALHTGGQAVEAFPHFHKALAFNQLDGNAYETMLTLQHLVGCAVDTKQLWLAMELGEEMVEARERYIATLPAGHFNEAIVGIDGTMANVYFEAGRGEHPNAELFLTKAAEIHSEIVNFCRSQGWVRLRFTAQAQLATTLWHLDRLTEAEKLFAEVVESAPPDIGAARGPAAFNRALVLNELGRHQESITALMQARSIFMALGNFDCVGDCDSTLGQMAAQVPPVGR
jgi:tetratricopeptide (TPR) repeat protein